MASTWLLKARMRMRRAMQPPWRRVRPYDGAPASFLGDLVDTWRKRELLWSLAYQRTIARYRRTILGPVWIMLAFMISTWGLSILWAEILGRPFHLYFPYITLGFFVWNYFVAVLGEGARALMDNKGLVLQTRTPMALYPIFTVAKQGVIALFNLPYTVIVMVIYAPPADISLLLVIPGAILVTLFAIAVAITLSVWCAYLPDLAEVIASTLRFAFFITPVLWMPFQRASLEPVFMLNPLFHMLNVVRGVVLHADHVMHSFSWMAATVAIAWTIAVFSYWAGAGAVSSRL